MQPFAEEQSHQCPYCGEPVDVSADPLGVSVETYTEDCPVCCRPWVVHVSREEDNVLICLGREDD